MILLSVRFLVSKNLAVLSAPTVTKVLPSGQKDTSKTSLSCVMTSLDKDSLCISHKEQVVSIEEQHIILGSCGFQAKLVNGEASSLYCLFIREHLCW